MNLEKRICNINIELTPETVGLGYLQIDFQVYDDLYVMYPCSTVSRQFSLFLHSIFCLYHEKEEDHHYHFGSYYYQGNFKREFDEKKDLKSVSLETSFDEEGTVTRIKIKRLFWGETSYFDEPHSPDPMKLTIISPRKKTKTYDIDGKDLCYAVAKACTCAIKKYGIFGYGVGTACLHSGDRDDFNFNELLYIKAYALNALEVRKLTYNPIRKKALAEKQSKYNSIVSSSFEKELELLLFDM